jgi:hypothetical protein
MATATATTTATTTTKPKIVASVQKKLDTAMKRQPSNNPGGSSNPGGGSGNPGGGGGSLGGGGNPGAPNPPNPVAPPMPPANQDARLMGSAPTEFDGDRAKADQFINELQHYFCVNATVPGLQSWICRVAIALTFIKGPTVDKWALNQGDWVDRLDPLIEDVPDVWTNFLIVKPAAGLRALPDGLGKCAVRRVPEHVFRLLRCALIGIAQSLSFEGKGPPLRTFEV